MPQSTEAFKNLIKHAATAAFIVDERGHIFLVSEMATKLFGYNADELIGKTIELLIPEQYRAEHVALRESFSAQAVSRVMGAGRQLHGLRKDGKQIAIEVSLSPVMLDDELYIAAWVHDDEERRTLESEMRIYHDRLAHIGRVTFASEMVAGISHEISQPLAAIANFAEAIQMRINSGRTESEEMEGLINPLIGQTLRAGEIVRNLRDFVSGRRVEPKACSMDCIVDRSVRFMENELLATQTRLEVESEPNLPELLCIEVQIGQVLDNLIRNAIEALEPLPVERRKIHLHIQSESDFIHVTISDWGDGLNVKDLEKTLDSFYTTKPDGMGVGLAICRTIIERHGGTLVAENRPGGGSRFRFTLQIKPKYFASMS